MARSYDELVTAALATGTFDHYVGDGASVPWQVAQAGSLPAGMTLWLYKAYLDARWPAGFKLHDWCYTPYGSMIAVTREEADDALREFIGRDSLADSVIVWAAVRAGGGPYFGFSQTGYTGEQSYGVVRDIASRAVSLLGASAMATKVVVEFQGRSALPTGTGAGQFWATAANFPSLGYETQQHTYGYSESFWRDSSRDAAFTWTRDTYAPKRAALLPPSSAIVQVRLYDGGSGAGLVKPLIRPGTQQATDLAQVAVLVYSTQTAVPNQRRWWVHNVPDDQVANGEFAPTLPYVGRMQEYLQAMATTHYLSQVPTNIRNIASVTDQGVVNFTANHTYTVGQWILVRRTTQATTGRRVGGSFQVSAIGPGLTQLTLAGWNKGACAGGRTWIPVGTLSLVGSVAAQPLVRRGGTRRVGRPSGLYRGRVSARRA